MSEYTSRFRCSKCGIYMTHSQKHSWRSTCKYCGHFGGGYNICDTVEEVGQWKLPKSFRWWKLWKLFDLEWHPKGAASVHGTTKGKQ